MIPVVDGMHYTSVAGLLTAVKLAVADILYLHSNKEFLLQKALPTPSKLHTIMMLIVTHADRVDKLEVNLEDKEFASNFSKITLKGTKGLWKVQIYWCIRYLK